MIEGVDVDSEEESDDCVIELAVFGIHRQEPVMVPVFQSGPSSVPDLESAT